MTSIMHPKWQFVQHVDSAATYTRSALANLRHGGPINAARTADLIDPRVPALAMARQAVAELDRATGYDQYVPAGAVSAARRARAELAQGMVALENGVPSLAPVTSHFQSTLNWLNVARNTVAHYRPPVQPPVTILPVPTPKPGPKLPPGAGPNPVMPPVRILPVPEPITILPV